jgi:hypothetical protein
MSDKKTPSYAWLPYVEKSIDEYYEFLKTRNKEFIDFIDFKRENIKKVFDYYSKIYYNKFDEIMAIPKEHEKKIDRHKVLAGYIFAFLADDCPIFKVKTQKLIEDKGEGAEVPFSIAYALEIYIAYFVKTYLLSFLREEGGEDSKTKIDDYQIYFPNHVSEYSGSASSGKKKYNDYSESFIKLLVYIKKDLHENKTCKDANISQMLMMSNILFLIEAVSDCANFHKQLVGDYYLEKKNK